MSPGSLKHNPARPHIFAHERHQFLPLIRVRHFGRDRKIQLTILGQNNQRRATLHAILYALAAEAGGMVVGSEWDTQHPEPGPLWLLWKHLPGRPPSTCSVDCETPPRARGSRSLQASKYSRVGSSVLLFIRHQFSAILAIAAGGAKSMINRSPQRDYSTPQSISSRSCLDRVDC